MEVKIITEFVHIVDTAISPEKQVIDNIYLWPAFVPGGHRMALYLYNQKGHPVEDVLCYMFTTSGAYVDIQRTSPAGVAAIITPLTGKGTLRIVKSGYDTMEYKNYTFMYSNMRITIYEI